MNNSYLYIMQQTQGFYRGLQYFTSTGADDAIKQYSYIIGKELAFSADQTDKAVVTDIGKFPSAAGWNQYFVVAMRNNGSCSVLPELCRLNGVRFDINQFETVIN